MKCIIHTNTRVIKRITVDENPNISVDETVVEIAGTNFDLGGGYWKLDIDNTTKIIATEAEIYESGVDETLENVKKNNLRIELNTKIEEASTDVAGLNEVKNYFKTLKKL